MNISVYEDNVIEERSPKFNKWIILIYYMFNNSNMDNNDIDYGVDIGEVVADLSRMTGKSLKRSPKKS